MAIRKHLKRTCPKCGDYNGSTKRLCAKCHQKVNAKKRCEKRYAS